MFSFPFWESLGFLKLNIHLSWDTAIPHLGIYPTLYKGLDKHVHSSFICNNQKPEITQRPSIGELLLFPHNGILLNNEYEETVDMSKLINLKIILNNNQKTVIRHK